MMLDVILPTITGPSRPSPLPGDAQAGLAAPGRSGDNLFAQLLLQAGADEQPLPPELPTPWSNGAGFSGSNLLAQMITENSGFAATPRNAPSDEAAPLLDDLLPVAAELSEISPRAEEAVAVPHLPVEVPQARSEPASNSMAISAGKIAQALPAEAALSAQIPSAPLSLAGAAPAISVATFDAEAPMADESSLSPATAAPLPTLGSGQISPTINVNAPGATADVSAPGLSAPLATPAWGRELSQQVVIAARTDEQSVSLRLNPADLGPLQIELKILDQQAHVQFLSPHAQVRGAVEQAIPQLREALAEQGIALADTSVGEQREQQSFASGRSPSQPDQAAMNAESDETVILAETAPLLADGRINVYV